MWRAVVGVVLLALVAVGVPSGPSAAAPAFSLSASEVMINGALSIRGAGVGLLQATHRVAIGSVTVGDKTLESWTSDEVRFLVRTEPGVREVAFEPIAPGGERVVVGSVRVLKYRTAEPGPDIVKGAISVRLVPGVEPKQVVFEGDSFARSVPDADPAEVMGRWYSVRVPVGSENARIGAYAALDGVELAEFDAYLRPAVQPNDQCYANPTCLVGVANSDQWNVQKARFTAAWETRRSGWPIAILDSGVRATHQELSGRVAIQRDFTGSGIGPCDAHGTGVASIAAANTNNNTGVAGAAWAANVGSYKVLAMTIEGCKGTNDALINAIGTAVADGYRIINMSIGRYPATEKAQNAVTDAWNRGAFLVAAAGNSGTNGEHYPSDYNLVYSVAASTRNDEKWIDSNWGSRVAMAAPGEGIVMAHSAGDDQYSVSSGTSMAAPLVAGAASLIRAANPGMSPGDVVNRLNQTADPVNFGATPIAPGGGRLNAYRALYPDQACQRDVPNGAWVRRSDGRFYQRTSSGVRQLPEVSVLDSWVGAGPDSVLLCDAQFPLSQSPSWGYRPGSLIQDPSNQFVYLITTDGFDRGAGEKRFIADGNVFTCLGFSFSNVRVGNSASLGLHPTGPDVTSSSCTTSVLRSFPNGTVVRSPGGQISVIDAGLRRPIVGYDAFRSWFGAFEYVSATDAELTPLGVGAAWGFRQGDQVQPAGSTEVFVVTDDGAQRATGSRRPFADYLAWTERTYNLPGFTANLSTGDLAANLPSAASIRNADWMP